MILSWMSRIRQRFKIGLRIKQLLTLSFCWQKLCSHIQTLHFPSSKELLVLLHWGDPGAFPCLCTMIRDVYRTIHHFIPSCPHSPSALRSKTASRKDFKPEELNLQCTGTFKSKVIQESGCDSSNTACFQNSKSVFSCFLYFLEGREGFLFHPYFTSCRSCTIHFLMSNNHRSATNIFELFSILLFTTSHNYINQCSLH